MTKVDKLKGVLEKVNSLRDSIEANKGPKSYLDMVDSIKEAIVVSHKTPTRSQLVLLNTLAKQYPIKIREKTDPTTGKKIFTGKLTEDRNFCKGWNVVFTGFRDAAWENLVKERSGRVSKAVTNSTTHVVAKDVSRLTGKLKKGQAVGAQIIKKDDFLNLLSNGK